MTMKNNSNDKIRRPPSTVTRNREPNFDLMAKALLNLYYQTKDDKIEESTVKC